VRSLVLLALAGCAPSGQILLYVDTDALVPPAAGAPADPTRPPWLFDRLRVEVLRDGSPAGDATLRDFAVDEAQFRGGRVSFGIAPKPGDADLSVRVRLFRADHARDGEPPQRSTLETNVALPSLGNSTHRELTVHLHTDDVGRPQGPIAADDGPPTASEVGSWPGAQIVPCATAAGADEACVPGGAYWMGDPLDATDGTLSADQERLVVISPFFVELQPHTVADFRHQIYTGALKQPVALILWDAANPGDQTYYCTGTVQATPDDPMDTHAKLPMNCLAWETASRFCQSYGRTLPTEAQMEFVASGRGLERGYPWGDDSPGCADAIWGRGGRGFYMLYSSDCRGIDEPGGLTPSGAGARDRVVLAEPHDGSSRTVVDLGGNLSTWTLDKWSRQDEPFWSAPGVFHDPIADFDSVDGAGRSLRGGAWAYPAATARAAVRSWQAELSSSEPTSNGARCVRPGM
jgi:formylglycine-generating enzyme required for sulfatase activity